MKSRLWILILGMSLGMTPAQAALRFGLGSAVAKRSADLITQAGNATNLPPLPSCGSTMAVFTSPPVTDPALIAFSPIGHVFPPGHTFPADHSYFNFNASSTQLLGINLYAPGDGWITKVTTLYGTGNSSDGYVIQFSACNEVKLDNLTVNTISPLFSNPSGLHFTTCSNFGGSFPGTVASCVTNMQVPVKAGQLLGTGGLVDFGPIEDSRSQIQGFINPTRHDLHRGFCPLNYFTPSLQSAYTAMLGGNNGATFIPRTVPPLCGTIMQDLAGTAQGDWFFPGAAYPPDNSHLALIHHNVAFSTASISCGTSIPALTGGHDLNVKSVADATRINYDWELVNDTQIYCYDTLLIEFNNGPGEPDPNYTGQIVLMQMSGSSLDTLKIELQNPGSSCAATAGTWAFTGAAVTFQR